MLDFTRVLHPSDQTVEELCAHPDVQSWCLKETYKPRHVSRTFSEQTGFLTPDLITSSKQWLIQAPASANVTLQSGLLRLGHRSIYESNLITNAQQQARWSAFSNRPPGWWHRIRKPKRHPQPLVLLSTHNNPNYFHWFTQPGLAPVFLQQHFCLEPLSSVALSHRPGCSLPSYVFPLLDIFSPMASAVQGVALASQSFCRFSMHQHCSEVVVSPAQVQWLQRRCHEYMQPCSRPWRRVFVSREGSSRRRCLNEDQVLAALSPYRFERHVLDGLRPADQLRLFSESTILVGVHGAGFSNLISCLPQSCVVELMPRRGAFSHYYFMADILGLNHGHLVGKPCNNGYDDFTVDPAVLINILTKMGVI